MLIRQTVRRKRMGKGFTSAGVAVLCVLCVTPAVSAQAAMLFCNHTQHALDVAIGYHEGKQWLSEGWWRIEPGLCSRVYGKDLQVQSYYYYALSVGVPQNKAPKTWAGQYGFCTAPKAFRALGNQDCEKKGLETKGFQRLSINTKVRDYTLDFHE